MIYWILFVIVICFGYVLFFGAPYLPTLKKQKVEALNLLNLQPGQLLLDLGCGDGRILNEAAKRGIKSIGYELNPIIFLIAKLLTHKNRGLISIRFANYWTEEWPRADGIYSFSIDKYMKKLDKKILSSGFNKSVKLVTYANKITGKKYNKTINALYLYEY
jgi:cyclopropane fatty-acyl-phospholipid synthase-like methyltransferase